MSERKLLGHRIECSCSAFQGRRRDRRSGPVTAAVVDDEVLTFLQPGMPSTELTAYLLQVLNRAAELAEHAVTVGRRRHRPRRVGERTQTFLCLSRDLNLLVVLIHRHFPHPALSELVVA